MKPEGEVRIVHSGSLPIAVDLHLNTYEGMGWIRRRLRGECGWLQVARATMDTLWGRWSSTLTVGLTEKGELLNKEVARALFEMRSAKPREAEAAPDVDLDGYMEMAYWDFLGRCDVRHLKMLEEAEADMAARMEAEQARGETVLREVDAYIGELHRRRRLAPAGEARNVLKARIELLEQKQDEASAWLVRRVASMREEIQQQELDILDALQSHGELEILATIYWVARDPRETTSTIKRVGHLVPSGGVSEDWRGSGDNSGLLRRAEQRGRLHGKVPLQHYRRERSALINRRRQNSTLPEPGEEPMDRLARISRAWQAQQQAGGSSDPNPKSAGEHNSRALDRDAQIQELIERYPSVEELDRLLPFYPGVSLKNRRMSRLIRQAIQRVIADQVSDGARKAGDGSPRDASLSLDEPAPFDTTGSALPTR